MSSVKAIKMIGSNRLLAFGAFVGFAMALLGVFKEMPGSLPSNTVARVNDQLINKAEYQSVLDRVKAKSRYPLTGDDRRQLLDRLIEERLLIQRGRDMGLIESDPNIRKAMVTAVMQVAVADVASEPVSDAQLHQFYKENKAYFSPSTQVHVQRLDFRGSESEYRANQALIKLREGEKVERVRNLADKTLIEPPDSPLPEHKLKAYLENRLFEQIQFLSSGDISEPIRLQKGFALLLVITKETPSLPVLDDIREQLINVYHRQQEESALQGYLKMLKTEAHIVTDQW